MMSAEPQVSRELLNSAIMSGLLQYYERTPANQDIVNDILKGRYQPAVRWVYVNISDLNEVAADCETFVLAAGCWIMLDNGHRACYDLDHALNMWEELPEFSPYQRFPYDRNTVVELKATLRDPAATDKLERAQAILRRDMASLKWPAAVVDSADEVSDDEAEKLPASESGAATREERQVTPPPNNVVIDKGKKAVLGSITKEVKADGTSKRARAASAASASTMGSGHRSKTKAKRQL